MTVAPIGARFAGATSMDYTTLSLADVATEFQTMARETASVFGPLDRHQLNWRPDDTRWSVAQCLDHLLRANALMLRSMDAAIRDPNSRSVWQRLPILPRMFGVILVKSQAPDTSRRFKAPRLARPATSAIDQGIVERFIACQHEATERVQSLETHDPARIIMVSPFVPFITYSVVDGCRLVAAHQRRHFEQARRVIQEPAFPTGGLRSGRTHV